MKTLHEKTLHLAKTARDTKRITNAEICAEAKVSLRWYSIFVGKGWKDPGVERVERIYRILKRKRAKGA